MAALEARSEVVLALPLPEAWARFLDPEWLPRWVEGLESVRLIKGRRDALGDRTALIVNAEGRRLEGVETVTRLLPLSVFGTRLENEDLSVTLDAAFRSDGDGTRLSCQARIRPRSLGLGLMAKTLLRRAQARQDRDLLRFKALAEGRATLEAKA